MTEQAKPQDDRTDAERFEQGLKTILSTPKPKVTAYMEQKKRERQEKRQKADKQK